MRQRRYHKQGNSIGEVGLGWRRHIFTLRHTRKLGSMRIIKEREREKERAREEKNDGR